jgi:thiol peroxidase
MATIKLQGNEIHTIGTLPEIGTQAPNFELIANDLSVKSCQEFAGKNVILNIFPSLDTGVCAASVRRFNTILNDLKDTIVLCISKDLPFAQARFCGAEGLENVVTLSEFRNSDFSEKYGVKIIDGPLEGLMSRAIVIVDKDGKVKYTEQVEDIVLEPNYDAALEALQ